MAELASIDCSMRPVLERKGAKGQLHRDLLAREAVAGIVHKDQLLEEGRAVPVAETIALREDSGVGSAEKVKKYFVEGCSDHDPKQVCVSERRVVLRKRWLISESRFWLGVRQQTHYAAVEPYVVAEA
jgi:hypothetical protein